MAVELNHTIVKVRDKRASAALANGATQDFMEEDLDGHFLEVTTRPYGSGP